MHIQFPEVNSTFKWFVEGLQEDRFHTVREDSRNGPVKVFPEPVTVTYEEPLKRVLFAPGRDANPFFHLYEAMWMLCGRNDVAPLIHYASNMGDFSDDGKTTNGAYGYRWRNASDAEGKRVDQLKVIIEHLKKNPTSRRAVLTMWNVEDDLLKIDHREVECPDCRNGKVRVQVEKGDSEWEDCPRCMSAGSFLQPPSKDVCCNTQVYFSIRSMDVRDAAMQNIDTRGADKNRRVNFLDMTVMNRSNDFLWGMLGANFVHFTFLQEYMARQIGVKVGKYHHFTNNLHLYEHNYDPEKWLEVPERRTMFSEPLNYGQIRDFVHVPLIADPERFDQEVATLVECFSSSEYIPDNDLGFRIHEPFLLEIFCPMMRAWAHYKRDNLSSAIITLDRMTFGQDWRAAGLGWIKRRQERRERRAREK